MFRMKIIFFIAILLVCQAVMADVTPGKVGVYCRLSDSVGSPYKLRQTMREIKAAGIDFIFPTGKSTSGQVFWDSKVAPEELVADRTYMEKVIKYAHAEGLKVYPVICVSTEGGDKMCNSLLQRNPSWAAFFEGGRKGYIDAGNADARRYEVALMEELVSKYDVDGLSLDYMRTPNRVSYTDTGREYFLKKHKVDIAKLVDIGPVDLDTEGGKNAQAAASSSAREHPIWPEWRRWRIEQLNTFMREIEASVHKAKPGLPISSYVWGYHTYTGNYESCQDWMTWIEKGWLDWINPSGYRYDDAVFAEVAKTNRAHIPKGFPMYITIGVRTSHGTLPTAEDVKRHMRMSKEAGADGLVFFTWEALRPFAQDLADDIKSWPEGR